MLKSMSARSFVSRSKLLQKLILMEMSEKPERPLGIPVQPARNSLKTPLNHIQLISSRSNCELPPSQKRPLCWCFMGWNQSAQTHVTLNVIMRLIGPPRGCPLKAMRFSLKGSHGRTLLPNKPHKYRSCDLWLGVPFRKLLRLKRTRAWTKKKQGPQTAPKENVIAVKAELQQTIWWQSYNRLWLEVFIINHVRTNGVGKGVGGGGVVGWN